MSLLVTSGGIVTVGGGVPRRNSAAETVSPTTTNARYVRAGATGAATGLNWTDAWTSFGAATWARDTTYYVAGGTYTEDLSINTAESGALWIVIARATVTTHGTDTGWSDAYSAVATLAGTLYLNKSYIEVNGAVGSDNSGHGIVIDHDTVNGAIVTFEAGKSYLHLHHVELQGTGSLGANPSSSDVEDGLNINSATTMYGLHVSYCWIHDVNRNGVIQVGTEGMIFEHNRVERTGRHLDPDQHGQGIQAGLVQTNPIYQFNRFVDIQGSAYIAFLGGSVVTNCRIYGNLFWATDRALYTASPAVIWTRDSYVPAVVTVDGFYVYNNTFHNLDAGGVWNTAEISSNAYARNNIWEDCDLNDHAGVVAEYNRYYNNIGTLPTLGVTDQTGAATAFVDAANRNYQLVSGATAVNTGTDLGADYNVDIAGVTRPQGAAWDMGAYERVG